MGPARLREQGFTVKLLLSPVDWSSVLTTILTTIRTRPPPSGIVQKPCSERESEVLKHGGREGVPERVQTDVDESRPVAATVSARSAHLGLHGLPSAVVNT